jgi:hypothetical protein
LGRVPTKRAMFGATHAPCCVSATDTADEFMETLPVQLAGTAAPTVPASPLLGTPTGDESFTSQLGRALGGMSESGQGGASIDPKASSRAKLAPDSSSDSAAMVFLNCLVTSFIQPASYLSLGTGSTESTISGQSSSTESSANSPSNFASSLNASTDEAGANTAKLPLPPTGGAGVAAGTLAAGTTQIAGLMQPARAGEGSPPMVPARRGGEESTDGALAARERGNKVATVGQNPLADAVAAVSASAPVLLPGVHGASVSNPPAESTVGVGRSESKHGQSRPGKVVAAASVSAPAWFPGLQGTSVSDPSAEPTVGGGQSESKSLQASTPSLGQDAGPWQDSQAAPGFNNLGTPLDTSGLAPVPAAPAPPSRENFPVPSDSTPPTGKTGQAAIQPPTTENNLSTPSLGHAEQAAAPFSQTISRSTTPIANGHDELAESSAALGKFSKMEMNVKVSKSGTTFGAALDDKHTAGSAPLAIGALQNSPGKIAGEPVQTPGASKAESPANNPAKATLDLPSTATTDGTGQKVLDSKGAPGTQTAPLLPSNPASAQQFALNSQPPAPGLTSQNGAAVGGNSIQSNVATEASASGNGAHFNLSDASTSGQGKFGQHSGQRSGDNPSHAITFAPGSANSPVPDPAGSLLAAHSPSVPASHTNTSTPPMPPSSSAAQQATTLSAWQNYDGGAGKIVRSASLTESAGGAEMHVELRSGPMGPIEVHTVVHDGSVGAEIHVQGQEAHTLLAAGLPSLERALTDRNLRVENIAVYQDHTGGGMGGGERQDSPSDSSPSPHHQALPWDDPPQPRSAARDSLAGEESANPAAGLSVQA